MFSTFELSIPFLSLFSMVDFKDITLQKQKPNNILRKSTQVKSSTQERAVIKDQLITESL